MDNDNNQPINSPSNSANALFIFVSLLFVLALYSFTPNDISSFSSDYPGRQFPSNLLGMLGAQVIWQLLLSFGFGTHAAVGILVLASIRRLFCRKLIRKTSWDYYAAIIIFLFSFSLLSATWNLALADQAAKLNLATLPGGIIGDFFAGPEGILVYVLNRVGITITFGVIAVLCLLLLYFYDWSLLVSLLLARKKESDSEDERPARAEKGRTKAQEDKLDTASPLQPELPLNFNLKQDPASEPAPPPTPKPATPPQPRKSSQTYVAKPPVKEGEYVMPPVELLEKPADDGQTSASAREIEANQERLQMVFDSFKVNATVVSAVPGPQVTLFKIKLAQGIKVERISNLENNIRMDLGAENIRILTPIPGESLVGIEIPNKSRKIVSVRSLMEDDVWKHSKYNLPILLGKNIAGNTICFDLARAPHLLVAGATGTGKSVCMNLIILSLLYKHTPETLRLIMVDPKKVEFSMYKKLPHLLVPVITENEKVGIALRWACAEMTRRYELLALVGCPNILSYNAKKDKDLTLTTADGKPIPEKMPFIVVIVDELGNIMLTSRKEVEDSLNQLAALSRAAGIHVILATQRPDVHVITGTIKNNFPTRIAFRVSAQVDSQTIIGTKGAEALLGMGDMLYKPDGVSLERIQGGMASDQERDRIVDYITKNSPPPQFDESVLLDTSGVGDGMPELPGMDDDGCDDKEQSLYDQALDVVMRDGKTSISYIQRRLHIGYNTAATLVEKLEENGIISKKQGTGPAEILVSREDYFRQNTPGMNDMLNTSDEDLEDDLPGRR